MSLALLRINAYADESNDLKKKIDIIYHCKDIDNKDILEVEPGIFKPCLKKVIFDIK